MNAQAWYQRTLVAVLLWPIASSAIVMAPLPEVPSTTATTATTTTMPTNSVATQALIDQLFTKADYEDFASPSSAASFMNSDEP